MTYDDKEDEWKLESTGRTFYAHTRSIGINEDGDNCVYGSDGGFNTDDWTTAEPMELASMMIWRWMRFVARL